MNRLVCNDPSAHTDSLPKSAPFVDSDPEWTISDNVQSRAFMHRLLSDLQFSCHDDWPNCVGSQSDWPINSLDEQLAWIRESPCKFGPDIPGLRWPLDVKHNAAPLMLTFLNNLESICVSWSIYLRPSKVGCRR